MTLPSLDPRRVRPEARRERERGLSFSVGEVAIAGSNVVTEVRFHAATANSRDSAERLSATVRVSTLSLQALLIVVDAMLLLYDLAQLLQAFS